MVELNGKHSMPYCADSGADVSVIGWKQLRTLMEIDGSVRTTTLANQVTIKTAGGHDMIASEEVELRLQLHTAAGPVVIEKPVSCLVLDMDNDEFILGKDVLAELGIDVDRQLEQLVVNEDTIDDDPIGIDDDATIGATDMEEVQEALSLMIDAAIENGFPSERRLELEAIVRKFDVWRLKLGDDPPARVPPLSVRLVKGAKPQKCKARHYPPHLVEFMRGFNAELERLGWVYENPTSRWASAALPVSKNGSNEYRQTSDYRAVNALLDAIAGMMPNLRSVTENVRGMRHFGLFDFIKGFWQLPLAEDSQEILSYMTDSKIYTPTRVPQGCSDAALHFQRTMETCFATLLYKHLLVWIDDLLLYAVTIDDYLDKLDKLLSLMAHYGLKLSAKKSNLYQRAVKWCGKLIVLDPVDEIDRSMERLRASVYAMHKEVADARLKQTMLNKKKERGDALVNFSVGDYILRSRVDEKHMNKLLVTWVGPYVVTEAYPRSFKVKHLVSGQEIEVHSSRLKFFADSSLEVTEQLLEHISSQGIILDVNAIRAHRWSPVRKDDEVLINWRGLEPIEDSWEPFDSIAKDVRTLLANYVAATDDAKLLKHWSKFKKRTTSWST